MRYPRDRHKIGVEGNWTVNSKFVIIFLEKKFYIKLYLVFRYF